MEISSLASLAAWQGSSARRRGVLSLSIFGAPWGPWKTGRRWCAHLRPDRARTEHTQTAPQCQRQRSTILCTVPYKTFCRFQVDRLQVDAKDYLIVAMRLSPGVGIVKISAEGALLPEQDHVGRPTERLCHYRSMRPMQSSERTDMSAHGVTRGLAARASLQESPIGTTHNLHRRLYHR